MAIPWIKVEVTTPEKPEIFAMADILNLDPERVFTKCVKVWRWADANSNNGQVKATCSTLDHIAGQVGFGEAMCRVGWLVFDPATGLCISNFAKHLGSGAKVRAEASERKQKSRESKTKQDVTEMSQKNVTDVTGPSHARLIIPRPLRRQVYEADNYQCVYCGFEDGTAPPYGQYQGAAISIDHVHPVSKGGDTTFDNLVTCCTVCNMQKTNKSLAESGMSQKFGRFVTDLSQECHKKMGPDKIREDKNRNTSSSKPPSSSPETESPPPPKSSEEDVMGGESKPKPQDPTPAPRTTDPGYNLQHLKPADEVLRHYQTTVRPLQTVSGGQRALIGCLLDGATVAQLKAAANHYAQWCDQQSKDPRYRESAAKFYGDGGWTQFCEKPPDLPTVPPPRGAGGKNNSPATFESRLMDLIAPKEPKDQAQ